MAKILSKSKHQFWALYSTPGTTYILTISGHKEQGTNFPSSHFEHLRPSVHCPLDICFVWTFVKEENDPKSGKERGEGQGNKEHLSVKMVC